MTELVLFGTRGQLRTLAPGRRQTNIIYSRKREHSRKPDELYDIIEQCSPGPYLELFARHPRPGWVQWGNEIGCREPAAVAHVETDRIAPLRLFQRPEDYTTKRTKRKSS